MRQGQAVVVGRGQDAQIRLNEQRASRQHIQIQFDGRSWVVSDLGAKNPARLIGSGQLPSIPLVASSISEAPAKRPGSPANAASTSARLISRAGS